MQIKVRSTDSAICLQSALANVAGFYTGLRFTSFQFAFVGDRWTCFVRQLTLSYACKRSGKCERKFTDDTPRASFVLDVLSIQDTALTRVTLTPHVHAGQIMVDHELTTVSVSGN